MKHSILSQTALASVMALALVSLPLPGHASDQSIDHTGHVHHVPELGKFVLRGDNGRVACHEASPEELAFLLSSRADERDLMVITPQRKDGEGLTIVLRGTNQLNNFPVARQAFITAAARWEELIASPITIIIDVDFGPTRFGDPYPTNVLGSTDSQVVGSSSWYPSVRSGLVSRASGSEETATANGLPSSTVPTDLGATAAVYTASANLRAIGLLSASANPAIEIDLGDPPSIGFNSNVPWDFDPSNGIDADKIDFDATVVHEIGHALGFVSLTGYRELQNSFPIALSVWDIFRFRPGVSSGTFGSSQRVLSSGGSHVFFAGQGALNLSTGRPNGTGGDEQQASHWKTRYQNSTGYIGIMDPTGAQGDRDVITPADIHALDRMGYTMAAVGKPQITALAASLDGDVLTVSGTVNDSDTNLTSVQATLHDPNGNMLAATDPSSVSSGGQPTVNFSYQYTGLRNVPGAVKVRLTFSDAAGNTSTAVEADFSAGDSGGPTVTSATYKTAKSTLNIKGGGFSNASQVEINGVILTGVKVKANAAGTSIKIKGSLTTLGLRSGLNSIRVRGGGGLRSNILVVSR